MKRTTLTFILVLLTLTAVLILLSTSGATAQVPAQSGGGTLPYSGNLTGASGQPVADGLYDFTFAVYDAPEGGARLWSEVQTGVRVTGGKFDVSLGAQSALPAAPKEAHRWLEIAVRGPDEAGFTALAPRQDLTDIAPSSPAAGPACAHTHLAESWTISNTTYAFRVENTGSGDGVRALSYSPRTDYAGLYAINLSTGSAVYGYAAAGRGVYGRSFTNTAVYASSDTGKGVQGVSSSNYAGEFVSSSYRGLYAKGGSGFYAGVIENSSGSTAAGLYVDGTLYVTGAKTGYVVDLAINDGPEPLETGDVVVIVGAGEPVVGQIPLIKVRKASAAGSRAVAGIVDQPVSVPAGPGLQSDREPAPVVSAPSASKADGTAVATGQYVNVVTLGSFKLIKVDASFGPIQPGDLLVSSKNAGYAMRSDNPTPGTIIGKALGTLESGTGVIPVLVTMQ